MRTPKSKVIKHFNSVDSKLAKIIDQVNFEKWFRDEILDSNLIFKSLCRTIIGQQLAGKAAQAIFLRFEDLMKKEITPQSILNSNQEHIREAGLSWAKVRSVTDLSNRVLNKELILEDLSKLDNETLIEKLSEVKGIGRWTAEMFMMFKLGREDIFSWGDLGLKKGINKFAGPKELSTEELEKIVETWSPYKTYAAMAMWHLLDNQ